MSHAPNYGSGQASDQATSGDQAGTGSNRRTDRQKGTRATHEPVHMRITSIATGSQPEHQARRSPAGERRQQSDHRSPTPLDTAITVRKHHSAYGLCWLFAVPEGVSWRRGEHRRRGRAGCFGVE
jgi:hypothetical protein